MFGSNIGVRGGGAAQFQGKRKLLKYPECKKYAQFSEISGHTLYFRASASCSNPECKKYIQYSECKATLFFRASAKLLKILNGTKCIQNSENFQGKRKLLSNRER